MLHLQQADDLHSDQLTVLYQCTLTVGVKDNDMATVNARDLIVVAKVADDGAQRIGRPRRGLLEHGPRLQACVERADRRADHLLVGLRVDLHLGICNRRGRYFSGFWI